MWNSIKHRDSKNYVAYRVLRQYSDDEDSLIESFEPEGKLMFPAVSISVY